MCNALAPDRYLARGSGLVVGGVLKTEEEKGVTPKAAAFNTLEVEQSLHRSCSMKCGAEVLPLVSELTMPAMKRKGCRPERKARSSQDKLKPDISPEVDLPFGSQQQITVRKLKDFLVILAKAIGGPQLDWAQYGPLAAIYSILSSFTSFSPCRLGLKRLEKRELGASPAMWWRSIRRLPPLPSFFHHFISPVAVPAVAAAGPELCRAGAPPSLLQPLSAVLPLPALCASISSPACTDDPAGAPTAQVLRHRGGDEGDEDDVYCDKGGGFEEDTDDDGDSLGGSLNSPIEDEELARDIAAVVSSLRRFVEDGAEARRRLEQCGVVARPELVQEALFRLRNDWAAAFTFFLWAGKQPGYAHSLREYHCMIGILGKMRRFDTAWSLVEEMKGGRPPRHGGPSLVTKQTLLIIIRRYCAAHDVAKAINTFYAFKKFGLSPGIEDFQGLLGALCRYKNVEDAEHLLLCNEKVYPFETKGFNIVLNGWCNVVVRLREAKRFWREMTNRGVDRDVVSYGCMISCFSKAGNLNDVLKLFNQIKCLEITPDRKVYNAVIYALAKGRFIDEAKGLVKTMEEKGVTPNAVTFNSLIRPLCKARRLEDARKLFDEMWNRGLSPCIRTYHAFFDTLKTTEEVFQMLDTMKRKGCSPVSDTYIMLIRKLCRWRQHESVFKLWDEMIASGFSPDRSAYVVLIHGLFLNGKLEEASNYYEEMKAKGFSPEPRTDEMLQAWLSGKNAAEKTNLMESGGDFTRQQHTDKSTGDNSSNAVTPRRDFLRQPEARNVTRERGFALW
ncbi:hypothetical protein Taro_005236 [Colocasia esculenta]|uniref:Pentatricopeptide repeat-containing protein n=1 Tax=Colocasia esculenta TaxID=4460 RepID=A0A843TSG0_COLES|nr:hypothetical protein [Colocasia esculenta]